MKLLTFARLLAVPLGAVAVVLMTVESVHGERGRGRGSDRAPGQVRKETPVTVPEPGTLSLLALGLAAGVIGREWRSRALTGAEKRRLKG